MNLDFSRPNLCVIHAGVTKGDLGISGSDCSTSNVSLLLSAYSAARARATAATAAGADVVREGGRWLEGRKARLSRGVSGASEAWSGGGGEWTTQRLVLSWQINPAAQDFAAHDESQMYSVRAGSSTKQGGRQTHVDIKATAFALFGPRRTEVIAGMAISYTMRSSVSTNCANLRMKGRG